MGRSRDLADGTLVELNVDSNTLAVDSTNNRVGIGTASPSTNLDIRQNTNADVQLQLYNNNSSVGYASVLKLNADNTTGSRYNAITSNNGATAQWRISGGGSDSTLAFATGSSNTERLRILSSGGITFNGDTSSSNALDDYEEGTWTPTLYGANSTGTTTYTNQTGSYTKIGRLVTCQFDVDISSMTGLGNIVVGGFPFQSVSPAEDIGACMLKTWAFPSGRTMGSVYIAPNSTNIVFFCSGSGVDWAVLQGQNVAGGIRATISYNAS